MASVTRLADILDFRQLTKPLATINLPKSSTFLVNFCKGVKIIHFSSEIILGNFYRHLAIFSGHTVNVVDVEGGSVDHFILCFVLPSRFEMMRDKEEKKTYFATKF